MRELFVDKKFGAEAKSMIAVINAVLDDYAQQGYDLSLRQLYYQLVSRNIVPNTEASYKNIGKLVSDARLAGWLDWDMIKDRGREVVENPHWNDPADFMRDVAPQYRFDMWADQEYYVEVMVEKQALEGVLLPVCRALDVPFTANKGYSSSSAMYDASKRFISRRRQGKLLRVVYLGDHDPSGIDMTRDIEERLSIFCDGDDGLNLPPSVQVVRVALNMDQVRQLNPPENPAKITDTRAKSYIAKYGRSSWELDAIEPKQLAALVEAGVHQFMDRRLFEKNLRKRDADRRALLRFAKEYQNKKGGK